jgi:hypothetical protein
VLDFTGADIDPSWWHYTEDQRKRVREIVREWVKMQCKKLAAHLPNKDSLLAALDSGDHNAIYSEANWHIDQYETRIAADKTQPEREFDALSRMRAEAARGVVGLVSDQFWVSKVFWAGLGDEKHNTGLLATFRGLLMRAVYYKLVPVAESLRWMLDMAEVAAKGEFHGIGPHGAQFNRALGAVAREIATVLCHGIDTESHALIYTTLKDVLYENGPVYPEVSE